MQDLLLFAARELAGESGEGEGGGRKLIQSPKDNNVFKSDIYSLLVFTDSVFIRHGPPDKKLML